MVNISARDLFRSAQKKNQLENWKIGIFSTHIFFPYFHFIFGFLYG
jgi:hypothetical protein